MRSSKVYQKDAFRDRVDFAASVIAREGTTTRNFDTCFEMSDGDSVAAALVRRARAKPHGRLALNLYRYVNRESAEAAWEATKHLSGADLVKHASHECERARQAFSEWLERHRAEQAAGRAD